MLERFVNGQDVFIFQPTIIYAGIVPERQITKSTKSQIKLTWAKHWAQKKNCQANRSITFYFLNELICGWINFAHLYIVAKEAVGYVFFLQLEV